MFDRVHRYVRGEDVFIAYARADGFDYARLLADRLAAKGFSCYLDQWIADPGLKAGRSTVLARKRAHLLIVVGSPAAAASVHVADEVEEFARSGRSIVPIGEEAVIHSAVWAHAVRGLPITQELSDDIQRGRPSSAVIDRVENSFRYQRHQLRIIRSLLVGTVVLLLSVIGLTVAVKFGLDQTARAEERRLLSETRRLASESQTVRSVNFRLSALLAAAAYGLQQIPEAADMVIQTLDHATPTTARLDFDGKPIIARFSPDGRSLIVADSSGSMSLIDAKSFRVLARAKDAKNLIAVCFNPLGGRITSISHNGSIEMWNIQVASIEKINLRPINRIVRRAAFDKKCSRAAIQSGTRVELWDIEQLKIVGAPVYKKGVSRIAIHPDRGLIALGGNADSPPAGFKQLIGAAADNDDPLLIMDRDRTGMSRSHISIYDPMRRQSLKNIATDGARIVGLAFEEDELVSTNSAGKSIRWSSTTGKKLLENITPLGMGESISVGHMLPNKKILVAGSSIAIWDPKLDAPRSLPKLAKSDVDYVETDSSGSKIAVLSSHGVDVWIIDLNARSASGVTYFDPTQRANEIAANEAGSMMASGGFDDHIRVWDISTGAILRRISHDKKYITALAINSDGTRIAFASEDDQVSLWSQRTDTIETLKPASSESIRAVRLHYLPGGTELAAIIDGTLEIFDVASGSSKKPKASDRQWGALFLNPSQQLEAAGATRSSLLLYRFDDENVKELKLKPFIVPNENSRNLKIEEDRRILNVKCHKSGVCMATTAITLSNCNDSDCYRAELVLFQHKGSHPTLLNQQEFVSRFGSPDLSLAFDVTGEKIWIGDWGVHLYDVPSRSLGYGRIGSKRGVRSLEEIPSRNLIVGAFGEQIVIHESSAGNFIQRLCQLAGKPLSDDERKRYLPKEASATDPCSRKI